MKRDWGGRKGNRKSPTLANRAWGTPNIRGRAWATRREIHPVKVAKKIDTRAIFSGWKWFFYREMHFKNRYAFDFLRNSPKLMVVRRGHGPCAGILAEHFVMRMWWFYVRNRALSCGRQEPHAHKTSMGHPSERPRRLGHGAESDRVYCTVSVSFTV
jgi:hypothetical protein